MAGLRIKKWNPYELARGKKIGWNETAEILKGLRKKPKIRGLHERLASIEHLLKERI